MRSRTTGTGFPILKTLIFEESHTRSSKSNLVRHAVHNGTTPKSTCRTMCAVDCSQDSYPPLAYRPIQGRLCLFPDEAIRTLGGFFPFCMTICNNGFIYKKVETRMDAYSTVVNPSEISVSEHPFLLFPLLPQANETSLKHDLRSSLRYDLNVFHQQVLLGSRRRYSISKSALHLQE